MAEKNEIDVSRYTNKEELTFDVEFITPAFLGGADGNAEIRTAPFKSLLRRWWRIVNGNLSPEELWKKESELFGSTEKDMASGKIFGKSKVVLKIIDYSVEFQKTRQLRFADKAIKHPEVKKPIEFEVYLGMGPVFWNKDLEKSEYKFLPILEYLPESKFFDSSSKTEKINPERHSRISFSLAVPKTEKDCFLKILTYINYFGTIGSRSRNGWGSVIIKNIVLNGAEAQELLSVKDIKESATDWQELINKNCVKRYPSAIAKDEKGLLCWRTPQRDSWDRAMFDAAELYSKVRTYFKFDKNENFDKNEDILQERYLLGYPVTHHKYAKWSVKNVRLPSELCIKIYFYQGKYNAQITHIPNLIPLTGFSVEEQKHIWKKVHDFFDAYQILNDKDEKKHLSRFGGLAK